MIFFIISKYLLSPSVYISSILHSWFTEATSSYCSRATTIIKTEEASSSRWSDMEEEITNISGEGEKKKMIGNAHTRKNEKWSQEVISGFERGTASRLSFDDDMTRYKWSRIESCNIDGVRYAQSVLSERNTWKFPSYWHYVTSFANETKKSYRRWRKTKRSASE